MSNSLFLNYKLFVILNIIALKVISILNIQVYLKNFRIYRPQRISTLPNITNNKSQNSNVKKNVCNIKLNLVMFIYLNHKII